MLLSAFACAPDWGSEPGVGWHWAIELAQRYDVTVLTHERFRHRIEAELERRPRHGLRFVYVGRRDNEAALQRRVDSRLHYWRWQFGLRRVVRRLIAQDPPDLIHHLTWGSLRWPSRLAALGPPFVIGPLGGGERAPACLWRSWPWRERAFYRLREMSLAAIGIDPLVATMFRHASAILVRNRPTLAALPAGAQQRAVLATEIGVDAAHIAAPRLGQRDRPGPLRLLYAGRLLGGKGVSYAVDATLLACAKGSAPQLEVAGAGRIEPWLRRRAAASVHAGAIRFLGWQPRTAMLALYDASDLLLFPSWHDSSGWVVVEALARGLPVLCLDLGGPPQLIDAGCGIVVPPAGRDEAGIVDAIADELVALGNDRPRLAALSAGATRRARDLAWPRVVGRAYDAIAARLGWAER